MPSALDLRRIAKRATPERFHPWLRTARLLALDVVDLLTGRRPDLVPPRRKVEEVGGHDFLAIGRHLLEVAIGVGELKPCERVLDVGSGVGRFAVPLTSFLESGSYEGFDLHRWGIRWCARRITPRFPRFRFRHLDLRNSHYNPKGTISPERFHFPYPAASFDLVFAASVYTHLTAATTTRYLEESARVLRPGGRLLASFFLLDGEPQRPGSTPCFREREGPCACADPRDPEAAIACEREWLERALLGAGFQAIEVRRGSWRGGDPGLSFQDFVLARRAAA